MEAGYVWARFHANQHAKQTLEDHAEGRGIEIIGLDPQHHDEIEYDENHPFVVWHECWEAVECFITYLSDQWLYTFNGIAGLNIASAMPVIACYTDDKNAQLEMLIDMKAFSAGIKRHYDEIQKENEDSKK